MAESLFTSQTPAVPDGNDSTAYTLGTKFSSSSTGSITHGRWYFPATAPSGAVSFVLYDATSQAELGRATFTGSGAGWRTVALSSPVAYPTPGTVLIAAVETPDRYVATLNFFSSTALTNGSLTSPADGDNGRLGVGYVYPALSPSDTSYFVDVVFEPAGAGPSQGSAGVGLDLAVAAAGARESRATAVVDVALAVGAAGRRDSAGVGDVGLVLAVSASGASPARGTAALELVLAVDARSGRAVVVRPDTGAVARPGAGAVVRPFEGLVVRP